MPSEAEQALRQTGRKPSSEPAPRSGPGPGGATPGGVWVLPQPLPPLPQPLPPPSPAQRGHCLRPQDVRTTGQSCPSQASPCPLPRMLFQKGTRCLYPSPTHPPALREALRFGVCFGDWAADSCLSAGSRQGEQKGVPYGGDRAALLPSGTGTLPPPPSHPHASAPGPAVLAPGRAGCVRAGPVPGLSGHPSPLVPRSYASCPQ